MIGRLPLAALAVLSALLLCDAVRAQTRDQIAAEALFRAGRAAMTTGDYATALARFQDSFRLDPSPGAVVNQAICEAELGQLMNARRDYRKVLELLPETDGRARVATRRLQELEKRLSWLTIKPAPDAPKETRVVYDEVALSAANVGVPLPLDPGTHELTVSAPQHLRREYAVTLGEGERRTLVVLPGSSEAKSKSPARSVRVAPTRKRSPTFGYILLGTGAVGLAVAAVTGVLLLDRLATVDAHCQDKRCDDVGLEAGSSGRAFRAATAIAASVGVVAGGIGGYLVLSNKGDRTEVGWRGSF